MSFIVCFVSDFDEDEDIQEVDEGEWCMLANNVWTHFLFTVVLASHDNNRRRNERSDRWNDTKREKDMLHPKIKKKERKQWIGQEKPKFKDKKKGFTWKTDGGMLKK